MNVQKTQSTNPYLASVDAIGDSYTFLITREAFFGARRFESFVQGLKMSRARLSERLKHLVANDIFRQVAYQDRPPRFEYRFTEKGLAIYPIALSLLDWGDRWRPEKGRPTLYHSVCGEKLKVETRCRSCQKTVERSEIKWPADLKLDTVEENTSNVRRWRKSKSLHEVSMRADSAAATLDAVGDRWSLLIMYLAQKEPLRFSTAHTMLGIADNILASRLQNLVREGLLARASTDYQAPYTLTESGRELILPVAAAQTWALDQLPKKKRFERSALRHGCGAVLTTDCVCKACGQIVAPQDVTIR